MNVRKIIREVSLELNDLDNSIWNEEFHLASLNLGLRKIVDVKYNSNVVGETKRMNDYGEDHIRLSLIHI